MTGSLTAIKIVAALMLAGGIPLARAQVIEIDAAGDIQTYAGPTQFSDDGARALDGHRSVGTPLDPARMLAEASRVHGLDPTLLEAVAWQESRGRQAAVSPKGARGIMQLMPATAAWLGVRADDPRDNVRGGALYLRQQIDRFKSVPLALAAYNAGPGAVLRYRGVPPYRETIAYVARIMQRWQRHTSAVLAASAAAPATNIITMIEGPRE